MNSLETNKPNHCFVSREDFMQKVLFEDVKDLKGLEKNIEKLAKLCRKNGQDSNMFKGDAFEYFIELVLMFHPNDSRLGLSGYQLVPAGEDNGVDAIAENFLGERSVIQIKYRSRRDKRLTASEDNLTMLTNSAQIDYGVVFDHDNPQNLRHFIFTNATGLNFYTDQEVFKGRLKCFGRKELRKIVDGNLPFWNSCRYITNKINA